MTNIVDSQVSSRKVSGMIEVCISAVREKERELVSDLEKKKRQNTEIINSQKELLEGELTSMQTGREFVERAFIGSEVEVFYFIFRFKGLLFFMRFVRGDRSEDTKNLIDHPMWLTS